MIGEWHPYPKETPPTDGVYITTVHIPGKTKNSVRLCGWSQNLYSLDNYTFTKTDGSGFYNYDSEYGYYPELNVIAWNYKPEPYEGEENV